MYTREYTPEELALKKLVSRLHVIINRYRSFLWLSVVVNILQALLAAHFILTIARLKG